MLGDNFYNRGVNAPNNGEWDLAFDHKFEKPYAGLGRLDMWAVAGNHDWYKGRESIDTQVAYCFARSCRKRPWSGSRNAAST